MEAPSTVLLSGVGFPGYIVEMTYLSTMLFNFSIGENLFSVHSALVQHKENL